MAGHSHYPKAPITEAIIDLRVEPCADLTPDLLLHVNSGVEKDYPMVEGLALVHGQLEVKPDGAASATANQKAVGAKFSASDKKYIWQSRRDGFTLSRLAPYEDWEAFRNEARRLWNLYREAVKPHAVVRQAVRYINRIDIPQKTIDLKEYFRTFPEVSPDLPQSLGGFFMQVVIPQDDLDAVAVINHTTVPPLQEGAASLVLDIDLFRNIPTPQEDELIWAFFEQLHSRKNSIFEACITDKTRELFR